MDSELDLDIVFSKTRAITISLVFFALFWFLLFYLPFFKGNYWNYKIHEKPLAFFIIYSCFIWAYFLGLYSCFPIAISKESNLLIKNGNLKYLGLAHPKKVLRYFRKSNPVTGKFLVVEFVDRTQKNYSTAFEITSKLRS